jgi:hypothetical protein
MSDLDSHSRHGAHRARMNPWRAVLPSLLAVASVVSLIVALTVWRGQDNGGAPAAFADGTDPTTSSTAPAVSSTPSVSATTPTTSGTPSTSASATTSGTTASALQVVVLNQSGRSGLGRKVSDTLTAAGWTVVAVGNFRGSVPATTVYYPAGDESDAAALAAVLPGTDRIRPRFGNLSTTRLTVVVTTSYPG